MNNSILKMSTHTHMKTHPTHNNRIFKIQRQHQHTRVAHINTDMDREIRSGSVSKQWLPKSGHREPLTKRDYMLMRPLTSKGHQDHSLARAKRTTSHQITLSCMKQNCTVQKFSKLCIELVAVQHYPQDLDHCLVHLFVLGNFVSSDSHEFSPL